VGAKTKADAQILETEPAPDPMECFSGHMTVAF
jgi:hypothetical protein